MVNCKTFLEDLKPLADGFVSPIFAPILRCKSATKWTMKMYIKNQGGIIRRNNFLGVFRHQISTTTKIKLDVNKYQRKQKF